jgi:hypothetical protein
MIENTALLVDFVPLVKVRYFPGKNVDSMPNKEWCFRDKLSALIENILFVGIKTCGIMQVQYFRCKPEPKLKILHHF